MILYLGSNKINTSIRSLKDLKSHTVFRKKILLGDDIFFNIQVGQENTKWEPKL